ncbi:hypothetical protein Tco_0838668 [Tanacetum coccineum]|uniref:Uncharacterized protein n=1 Tax=Tanacetum coccineum TaxID=301880 RepID=A0ABQ5ANG3_9ASTR
MPCGTTQVVTRGHLIIWYEVLFIVCRSEVWSPRQSLVYEVRRSRVLEVDVAHCDWWIQLQTAGGYEVQRIENKAKTSSGNLARVKVINQEVESSNPRLAWSEYFPSGDTWPTQVVPRGGPDPDPDPTRPDPLVDWRSTTIDQWSAVVRGTIHPRWQYEVAKNVRWQYEVATAGQSTRVILRVSDRGRRVSVRGNHMAIMRRLVECKKTKIPSDLFWTSVSPIVSTLFVEQFWTTTKSRTVNNTSYIDATVAGKPVTISEASIRSDLVFDDADGIDSLNNQAIFDNIQLMGQMNANDKNGLGYGTQMDEMSNKFETDSEISMSIFEVRSSDEEITSANDRFSKADGYHVVPPPITGNFLTQELTYHLQLKKKFKMLAKDDVVANICRQRFCRGNFKRRNVEKFPVNKEQIVLHDTIAAQRKFLAQTHGLKLIEIKLLQESAEITHNDESYLKHMKRQIKELKKDPKRDGLSKTKLQGRRYNKWYLLNEKVTDAEFIDSEIHGDKNTLLIGCTKVSSPVVELLVVYRVNVVTQKSTPEDYWLILLGRLEDYDGILIQKENDQVIAPGTINRMGDCAEELLQQMLDLGLEVEKESNDALTIGKIH